MTSRIPPGASSNPRYAREPVSFERAPRHAGVGGSGGGQSDGPTPGKQTLTEALDPVPPPTTPVQRRTGAAGGAGAERTEAVATADIHAAAALGTSGPSTELPHRDPIQRAFGRHDVGHIKAHVGGAAQAGTAAMGADAFATGDRVAFAAQPDLHTAAHEAAHVVQQRGGVQLAGGVGEAGDTYEKHADDVADLVVQGQSAEALLDQHSGQHAGQSAGQHAGQPAGGGDRGGGAIQRHAFVGGTQIKKSDPLAKGAAGAFITDDVVRSYKTRDELVDHAAGTTDYLGNLDDGTWLRFHPTGLNVLGEMHTLVTLTHCMRAVGSKSFISERFATDDLATGSNLKAEYEEENEGKFKEMGIDSDPDKKKYGAESLFPKIGYALAAAVPFFNGTKPIEDLTTKEGYTGKPLQRYLKLGWAHALDVEATVRQQLKAKQAVPATLVTLCQVVTKLKPSLDPFIAALKPEGFLGDAIVAAKDKELLPRLLQLANAVVDAMFEQALSDPTARLDDKRKKELGSSPPTADKLKVFSQWRNFNFEDSVKKAAAGGVRYAGMGAAHLYHLQDTKTLPKDSHPYDMSGDDLDKFQSQTKKLASRAKKQ
jgi:hypothetical protein